MHTATGKVITAVSVGTKKDVDLAVDAAKKVSRTLFNLSSWRVGSEEHAEIGKGLWNITTEQCNRFDFIQAYKTTWGLHCPGAQRGRLLNKLADLLEQHIDELAALEALDVGENPQPIRFPFRPTVFQAKYLQRQRSQILGEPLPPFDTMLAGLIKYKEKQLR